MRARVHDVSAAKYCQTGGTEMAGRICVDAKSISKDPGPQAVSSGAAGGRIDLCWMAGWCAWDFDFGLSPTV